MDVRQIPTNELLLTALHAYETSHATKKLKSEQNRTIFAEDLKTKQVPLLSAICLKTIAENYKGRPINLDLTPIQSRIFYDCIDPYLPIEKCINIEDEIYWKRVYCLLCDDQIAVKKRTKDRNTCWKELVINMKYVEVIESTAVEIWLLDEMHKLSKLVSPYIKEMQIRKLQSMRESSFRKTADQFQVSEENLEEMEEAEEEYVEEEMEKEDDVEDIEECDVYPVELCHHVDLRIVKNLSNLHSLIVEFQPPKLGIHYHTRFFNFSYVDMQNLASGISKLPNLRRFCIRRSRMDCIKLSIILEVVKTIFVEHLEFSYCQLDDECGESLYEFIHSTSCLKNFNLSGNHIRDAGIHFLAKGIESSPSSLTHINVSNNPITDEPICRLMKALDTHKELISLSLSGLKITRPGSICIAKFLKTHHTLEDVDLTASPMEADYLIDCINDNKNIQQLFCQGCGLTDEEEFKVELLVKRNRYIRENPYIGDSSKTEEEINAFVTRIKNPILLEALAITQSHENCRKKMEEQANERVFETTQDGNEEFYYESHKFTRAELSDRITLFAQTDSDFFAPNKNKSKRCQ